MLYFPSLDRVGELYWANDRERTTARDRGRGQAWYAPASPGRNVLKMEHVSSSDGHNPLWENLNLHQGSLHINVARTNTHTRSTRQLARVTISERERDYLVNVIMHLHLDSLCESLDGPSSEQSRSRADREFSIATWTSAGAKKRY